VSPRRDHVSARTVSGKAGQVARMLRLRLHFVVRFHERSTVDGRAADEHEARALSSNPYLYLLALGSGRATLVFWTIQIQAGQTIEQAVIWEELRVRPDPSKEWSPEPR
jgi:hypothetical protein